MGELIELDGKRYRFVRHSKDGSGAMILKEIDMAKHQALIDRVSERLIVHVNREEVLKAALSHLAPTVLARIDRNLRVKKKTVKKRGGCIELEIGDDAVLIQG